MSSFSSWFLSPKFQIESKSPEFFETSRQNKSNLFVSLVSEEELQLNSSQFKCAESLYGELKPKVIYRNHIEEKEFIYIHPQAEPKKLSSHVAGRAHICSSLGALFSGQLNSFLSSNKEFESSSGIFLTVSDNLKKIMESEKSEFLIGILQKSVTNKIKKKDVKFQQKNIYFLDNFLNKEDLNKAIAISNAMCATRSFINMPPNALNPDSYEALLRSIVRNEQSQFLNFPQVEINVHDYEKLLNENCTLICAVGQGSHHKPRIIKLTYSPKSSEPLKHISLVGKGITFDSGGYDIKSAAGMRHMKKDMGGSAAALGIFFACASLQLPVKVTCYLAIAENMISAGAMRPGDIYKTRNGFHVEIENTDAEGRLVLADALSLACEEKPNWIIDLATLTGAARVSLGPIVDTVYGNHKGTTQLLVDTGIETGDWVWEMPLVSEYEVYLESSVADFMNSSSAGFAGSGTAALFLQKFVSVEKWNHIDTYMWCDKPHYLWQEGSSPTGKCVRLVTRAIEKFVSKEDNSL